MIETRTEDGTVSEQVTGTCLVVVVPVKGKDDILGRCIESLATAVENCPTASLVLVDNNGPDGGADSLTAFADRATIIRSDQQTVAAVRNAGARVLPHATHFAFVDCDCVVRADFCNQVLAVFRESSAQIVGCTVVSPADGNWLELASDRLHRNSGDGPRQAMNSGCMAVLAPNFWEIGGFDVRLAANEDYDLCTRIRAHGGSIWQSERLQAVHMGNPKSAAGHFRRLRWHGMGAVNADGSLLWSPMLVFTFANLIILVLGLVLGAWMVARSAFVPAVAIAILAITTVPMAFVAARTLQRRRWISPLPAIALMQLTFLARAAGVARRWSDLRSAANAPVSSR